LPQQLAQMGESAAKRTYLVVVDDSAESRVALRFAARRAAKTSGRIEVLGIVEPQDFVQFGGVQAAIEQEQRLRIEGVVSAGIGDILDESGVEANIIIQQGEVVRTVRDYLEGREDCAALVLGAAPSGSPGPLVVNFTGNDAGKLPCPVMIIPGSLTDERLEQLS
jgi:nucleotide-binding universal stress UspA family protein